MQTLNSKTVLHVHLYSKQQQQRIFSSDIQEHILSEQ